MKRRDFLKYSAVSTIGAVMMGDLIQPDTAEAAQPITYGGEDLAGWDLAMGDGIYAAAGQDPVSMADIETIHYGTHSELKANIQQRGIMAHNISFQKFVDDAAFDYIHKGGFEFRLPYVPTTSGSSYNAQTFEGGLFIWDGKNTRLDYGLAFQWVLNPWMSSFGEIWCWSDENGGQWTYAGHLTPDTNWHNVKFVLDYQNQTTALTIDDVSYLSKFTRTPKPDSWAPETAGRLQAEIISIWPGSQATTAPMHLAEVRRWFWNWQPNNT